MSTNGSIEVSEEQARTNSSRITIASTDYAMPARDTVGGVADSQSDAQWSVHAQASSCRSAYSWSLNQLKECLNATLADLQEFQKHYDLAISELAGTDEQVAKDSTTILQQWDQHQRPIVDTRNRPPSGWNGATIE